MAVRLPTPKVDLSESILDPNQIPGQGDIRITHPDVTTDFDWPEIVPRRGDLIKRLHHRTVFSTTAYHRSRILLASLHRRRRSCAPPHRDGTSSDGRRLQFGQRRAATAIRFNGKCCYSITNDPNRFVVVCLSTPLHNPYFLFLLSSFLFQRRSNGHRAAALRREATTGVCATSVWLTGKPIC